MATDQEIAQALQTLLRETNPNAFTSLNAVVQQLQSKLGFDLTHKVDFIRNQIQLLFRPHHHHPPPQPPQHHPHKDHFALQQNPNFPTHHPSSSPFPPQFQSFQPVPKTEPAGPVQNVAVVAPEAPKESVPTKAKRKGGPGGLNKVCGVSPELQAIVGQPALPRTEIVKQLWAYIRKNNLQDPSNKRKIICNDELRLVFETDCTDMFKMNKLLAKHIIPLEPTKPSSAKKPKVEVESGTKSTESGPSVLISEALANFFGTDGREMLQSEVIRRVWEYIKVNHLEDPLNSMMILCDAKLQELFGCESISALGIPEMLAHHHILKR
ncbi:hypothetical protein L1049_000262 [Liquidambar formosana]|uniref:DM2 domain-containing protein n=1 Tax=Liquidambar formosana TaxID=63359 RepID=A0AAP0NC09_LIQFO